MKRSDIIPIHRLKTRLHDVRSILNMSDHFENTRTLCLCIWKSYYEHCIITIIVHVGNCFWILVQPVLYSWICSEERLLSSLQATGEKKKDTIKIKQHSRIYKRSFFFFMWQIMQWRQWNLYLGQILSSYLRLTLWHCAPKGLFQYMH